MAQPDGHPIISPPKAAYFYDAVTSPSIELLRQESQHQQPLSGLHAPWKRVDSSTSSSTRAGLDPNQEKQNGDSPVSRLSTDNDMLAEKDVERGEVQESANSEESSSKHEKQREEQPSEDKDPNLVEFDGPDDKDDPQNLSNMKKWTITLTTSLLTLTITFASSIFSTAVTVVPKEFDVGEVVGILGVSLFVLGFAFGPMIWGPFSELYGRKLPLLIGFGIFAIFQVPVAVAENLYTIMICRFFGGFFGCAPLTIVAGILADIWDPVERGVAISIFSAATFIGPVAGPIVGGFVTQAKVVGWRWTAWLTLFLAGLGFVLHLVFVPETFAPLILQRRAKRLRVETKNWALHSKLDETQTTPKDLITRYLARPMLMLALEPILLLITIYMALIYGILYLFFEAYPISFTEQRGWNLGIGALPFVGIMIGVVIGAVMVSWITKTRFKRKLEENDGKPVPEERLVPMMIGAFILPAGLFWFAWTSSPHITYWPQVISGIPIGMGVYAIFLQGLNYIVDTFLMNANSAIAGNTFLRSLSGAGFPLFATAMYRKLGVAWATSLLGFLCVAFIPVPILFFIYGARLRKLSRFSPSL